MKIEKATIKDVKQIHDLIEKYSKKGLMLYRYSSEIEIHIRDYYVCKDKKKIVGCCGLRVWDKKSCEIYALVVNEEYVGSGLGTKLVKRCIEDSKNIKMPFVFTLTFRPNIFERLGFKKIKINSLPKIIFTEKTVDVDKAYGLKI